MPPIFEKSVRDLDDAVTALSSILRTQDGVTPPSVQEYFGYKHAYQIFYSSVAFQRHVQISKFNLKGDLPEIWDTSTLATIARNIWDTYASYRFYCHEPETAEIFVFRKTAAHYIAEIRRLQMITKINPTSAHISDLEVMIAEAKSDLELHPNFQQLDVGTQKKLIRDKEISAIFIPHEILRTAGINKEFFQSGYKYLSNHSHFYSFAFTQALTFDINENEGQNTYKTVLEYASLMICFFLEDFKKWYPGSEYIWSEELTKKIQYWKSFMLRENQRRQT